MSEEFQIGDRVRLKRTATNFGDGLVGILEGFLDGGFAVRLEANIPVAGVIPTWEKREAVIWAEDVEKVQEPNS
jgi:hypothetical protein